PRGCRQLHPLRFGSGGHIPTTILSTRPTPTCRSLPRPARVEPACPRSIIPVTANSSAELHRYLVSTLDLSDSWAILVFPMTDKVARVELAAIETARIPPIHGVIAGVAVQVRPPRDARWVFGQPAPQHGVIIACPHVVEPGLLVVLLLSHSVAQDEARIRRLLPPRQQRAVPHAVGKGFQYRGAVGPRDPEHRADRGRRHRHRRVRRCPERVQIAALREGILCPHRV